MSEQEANDKTRTHIQLSPDITFANYRLIDKIGAGGMGEVYLAEDTQLERRTALKFLPPQMCEDMDSRARFRREAQAAAKLNHPNIVTIYEVGELEGRPYIAMELVDGEPLKEHLKKPDWSSKRAIDVALQVCEGLRAAHSCGVIHRDIKPSNILIDSAGRCRLVDFGLAAIQGQDQLTKSGSTVGTFAYMSPEQVRGGKADARSDLFSLGVVLYEMVSGHRPFTGEYEAALLYAIAHQEPEPIEKYVTDVPLGLQAVLDRVLKKDPDLRYQSAADLADALRRLLCESDPRSGSGVRPGTTERPSIAVLPFQNLSADREQEYFCDGMAEEITNALSHIEELHVVARTSAFAYREGNADVREIGRRLGVGHVLEGSVRKAGNRLRITAQLVDVESGYHLWSERFDRELADVFEVQDEIALAIVKNLKVRLLAGEQDKLMRRYTDDPVAYSLYLKGRYLWNRRYEGGLTAAIDNFEQAIRRDVGYAPAYVGVADCYNQFGHYSLMPARAAYARSKVAVAKAIELDETLAEAHASVGWIHTFYDWDWAKAEDQFLRAIELNPNCALAHNWYGLFLAIRGRYVECIREGARSLELEPLSLIINATWGLGCYWTREFDRSIAQLQKTIAMDPSFFLTYLFLGFACAGRQKWDDAEAALNRFIEVSHGSPVGIGHLGLVKGLAGKPAEAREILEHLQDLSTRRYVSPFYEALVHMGLGDHERAFEYLHRAVLERESWIPTIGYAPFMDCLRGDPGFEDLQKEIGLIG